jgi:hypothetical protein
MDDTYNLMDAKHILCDRHGIPNDLSNGKQYILNL